LRPSTGFIYLLTRDFLAASYDFERHTAVVASKGSEKGLRVDEHPVAGA
jgi:hypothetical protein